MPIAVPPLPPPPPEKLPEEDVALQLLPPPPPPTAITLTFVTPLGTVNVPDEVNTWMLLNTPEVKLTARVLF